MSRRQNTSNNINLIIDKYKMLKQKEKELKNEISNCQKTIKDYMIDTDVSEISNSNTVIKINKRIPQEFDTLKALQIIKNNCTDDIKRDLIVVEEKINDDILEDMIATNKIDANLFKDCIIYRNEIVTLRVSDKKGSNEND